MRNICGSNEIKLYFKILRRPITIIIHFTLTVNPSKQLLLMGVYNSFRQLEQSRAVCI